MYVFLSTFKRDYMIHFYLLFCVSLLAIQAHPILSYGLPAISLGGSNFLDGGPLRPHPGLYWQQNTRYYHADVFRDANGHTINTDRSVDLNSFATLIQFFYQFRPGIIPNAQTGLSASLPVVLHNKISCNPLGFNSSGGGLGDLAAGIYLQFDTIMEGERPIFVHRLELDAVFPTGKNKEPLKNINPGNNLFYILPYWSFTLYMNPKFGLSARTTYLWSAEDKKTGLRPGQAVYINYTLEALVAPKTWLGINGYFLQQLKDNKLCGVEVPHSKEQVFSTGVGALYIESLHNIFFFNIYFECFAKNRPQGISCFFRYLRHF
jgi:hypothetical protein